MKARSAILRVSLLTSLAAACTPGQTPAPVAMTHTPPVTATTECVQELISPRLAEILPAEPLPGSEITVLGAGGYLQDSCGGYNESSRLFTLYLDREPAGDLTCYVNRCEARVRLPDTISAGSHCLSVDIEECQLEFRVSAQ